MTSTPEYRATRVIKINGARAFNPGDPVPAGHVERFKLTGSVEKVTARKEAAPDGSAPGS